MGFLTGLITYGVILGLLHLGVEVLNLFVGLSSVGLKWVTSNNFISLKFTNNEFVNLGWTLSRDLANIGIVIVLVFIALATILRIKDYQAQKVLPILIIVALLINFSPVLCGVLIDGSNIVMNTFLKSLNGVDVMKKIFGDHATGLVNVLKSCIPLVNGNNFNLVTCVFGPIVQAITLILFELGIITIFSLFGLLFALRYVALWMLVILSPFAFVCYIIPATKGVWNNWWKQFVQWCIIGIPAAFFLSLGLTMMNYVGKAIGTPPTETGLGLLNGLLPYGLVLAFLIIGFVMALTTSATGASAITSGVKAGIKKGGKALAKNSWAKAKPWLKERVPEKARRMGERMSMAATPGTGQKGVRGAMKRGASAPFFAMGRAIGKTFGTDLTETERADSDNAKKEVKGKRVEKQVTAFREASSKAQKIGILGGIIEDHHITDALKDIKEEEIKELFKTAKDKDIKGLLRVAFPEFAHDEWGENVESIFKKIRTDNYTNMSDKVLEYEDFIAEMIVNGTGNHISKFIDRFGREGAQKIEETIRARANIEPGGPINPDEWLKRKNTPVHEYLTKGQGQGLIGDLT